ncbi:MAG: hypothetical protein ACPLQO_01715 [Desulfotomaculales bacterium]
MRARWMFWFVTAFTSLRSTSWISPPMSASTNRITFAPERRARAAPTALGTSTPSGLAKKTGLTLARPAFFISSGVLSVQPLTTGISRPAPALAAARRTFPMVAASFRAGMTAAIIRFFLP